MSAHRQHYFEANFAPEQTVTGMESRPVRIAAVALALVALGAAAAHLAANTASEPPVITPVRSPEIVHYQLPPMQVVDARIEGFRAGMAEGLAQQGCMVQLSAPIATR